jgi:hypothetical protein
MPQKDDDGPNVLIAENPLRRRHAGGGEAILDDPFQLAVAISLNFLRCERRDWRRHIASKGDTGILSVATVTDDAIEAEGLLSGFDLVWGALNGIFIVFATDSNSVLGPLDDCSFSLTGVTLHPARARHAPHPKTAKKLPSRIINP